MGIRLCALRHSSSAPGRDVWWFNKEQTPIVLKHDEISKFSLTQHGMTVDGTTSLPWTCKKKYALRFLNKAWTWDELYYNAANVIVFQHTPYSASPEEPLPHEPCIGRAGQEVLRRLTQILENEFTHPIDDNYQTSGSSEWVTEWVDGLVRSNLILVATWSMMPFVCGSSATETKHASLTHDHGKKSTTTTTTTTIATTIPCSSLLPQSTRRTNSCRKTSPALQLWKTQSKCTVNFILDCVLRTRPCDNHLGAFACDNHLSPPQKSLY